MEQEKNKGEARAAMEDKVLNTSKGMNAPALYDSKQEEKQKAVADLIQLPDVAKLNINWLWEPYIQVGNISILRGDPGVGKTYFVAAIMAAIANGYQPEGMPGTLHNEDGRCIYFGSEDDPETIRARVEAAGCMDLSKLYIYPASITLKNVETIRELINSTGSVLIIFDPIQSYLGAGVDMNRANEVAPILNDLRDLARETGCAVLIIEHQNKNQKANTLYRGIGSMTIAGAARSILTTTRDPEEPETRCTMQIKTNAKQGDIILWRIEDNGRFTWCGKANRESVEARSDLKGSRAAKLIKAIMRKHPDGWGGTVAELIKECPEIDCDTVAENPNMTIGRELCNAETRKNIELAYNVFIEVTNPRNRKTYHVWPKTTNENPWMFSADYENGIAATEKREENLKLCT